MRTLVLMGWVALLVGGLAMAGLAADAKVKYDNVPPGTTITYEKDGVQVTEPLVAGKEYPASAVVTLGEKGSITVTLVGSSFSATIQGDKGASFNLSGSTAVGGIVGNVPSGGSNIRMKIGDGNWMTIAAGASSSGGGNGGGSGGGSGGGTGGDGNSGGNKNPTGGLHHRNTTLQPPANTGSGGGGGSSSGATYP
jgi:hypothetical protein